MRNIDDYIKYQRGNFKVCDTHVYGGIFDLPIECITLSKGIKNNHSAEYFMDTKRGIKIQKALVYNTHIKPVRRWCINRKIHDKKLIKKLTNLHYHNKFDGYVKSLNGNYNLINIIRKLNVI
jgi:hypothetical protein